MKNKLLVISNYQIPYIKPARKFAGSVAATILWQQIEFIFFNHGQGFYKFMEPCDHPRYVKGDSWIEELGFSADEFRTAYSKIGTKYLSHKEYQEAKETDRVFFDDKGVEKMYASFYDKIKKQTFYFRNDELVDRNLDAVMVSLENEPRRKGRQSTPPIYQIANEDVPDCQSQVSTLPIPIPKYTETISEKTYREDIYFLFSFNSLETDADVREAFAQTEPEVKKKGIIQLTEDVEQGKICLWVNLPKKKRFALVSQQNITKLPFDVVKVSEIALESFCKDPDVYKYFRPLSDHRLMAALEESRALGMGESKPMSDSDMKRYFNMD